MEVPTWLQWYKKPEYRDIKQYSTDVRNGRRSISSDGKGKSSIPPHLSLDRVLANKTCSPMSLYDFYMYLKHIEYSPENLEFYVWFKNYEARWSKHSRQEDYEPVEKDLSTASTYQASEGYSSETELGLKSEPLETVELAELSADPEIASETTTQILEVALPKTACTPLTKPKRTARDHLRALTSACTNACALPTDAPPTLPGTHPFDAAPELSSIIQTYLLPSSPKELNIPPALRDTALEALKTSPAPVHLAPIAGHVYDLLRTCSHPNFLRLGVANGTLETVCVATSLGIALTLAGLLFTLLRAFVPFPGAHTRLVLLASWFFWFLGLSFILSGLRGSCFFLLLFSRRQPLPWERFDDSASLSSVRSGVARVLGRLMIFDRKLRVGDVNLRRLQRKIVLQSLAGGAIGGTIGVMVFAFLPVWKETVKL
ncbi:hypothetical protein HYQ45_011480 [Verticillium longisporum]|uniref:RGS domain-containing protein n=1 Tax=Verticillium longisporum TaxID=100787 RepID=A0A8I3AL68_VERLO|nr:hypothetical protein HYQ45_011480 [Verticillium longisporum]RBQ93043.1 hypothetical protein VDGD_02225 [Verticillium dahliae]